MTSLRSQRFRVETAVKGLLAGTVKPTIACFELRSILETWGESVEGEQRYWQALVRYYFGFALDKATAYAAAAAALRDCADRFGNDCNPEIASIGLSAAVASGSAASRGAEHELGVRYLDLVIEKLRNGKGLGNTRLLASALLNRAAVVRRIGVIGDTVAAYDLVIERFGACDDPLLRRELATALYAKATALEDVGERTQALEAYRTFLRECSASSNATTADMIVKARSKLKAQTSVAAAPRSAPWSRSRRGQSLAERGVSEMGKDPAAAIQHLDKAIKLLSFEAADDARVWLATALYHRGLVAQRAMRYDEAMSAFRSVLTQFTSVEDDDIRGLIDGALTNSAFAAAALHRFDEALETMRSLIARASLATGREQRRTMASALYNRATILRDAGRTEDALDAFDQACERFGNDEDPEVFRFAGLSFFNRGQTLFQANLYRRAIPSLRACVDVCATEEDPVVRERAARALSSIADSFAELQCTHDAWMALSELVDRFAIDIEASIQAVAGNALLQYPKLLLVLPPAPHFRSHRANRQMVFTILNDCRDNLAARDELLRDLDEQTHLVSEQLAKAHSSAVAILDRHFSQSAPFALLLRAFKQEAIAMTLPEDGTELPYQLGICYPDYGHLELRVRSAIGQEFALLSIANPDATTVTDLPKLSVGSGLWEAIVTVLVQRAAMIVFLLEDLTPGVSTELERIVKLGRQDSTLIIAFESKSTTALIARLKQAQVAGFGTAPADPAFPRFAVVIDSIDLPEIGGRQPSDVKDLVHRLGFLPEAQP